VTPFDVGVGKADLTSHILGVRFFGYGEVSQVGEGLEQRLYARAFIVRGGGQAWVYVICDLGKMSRLVRRRVEERLRERFGDRYPPHTLCLAVTHTHSATGGYSQFFLYNLSILGWSARVTDRLVEGIVEAISQADASLAPGRVGLAVGRLADAAINRMQEAYELNPPEERARFALSHDDSFVQLHLRDAQGRLRGLLNWFAVHGTSHDKKNRLVSPDNKGYASWLVERELGVVAGFALSNHADVSPNRVPTPDKRLIGEGATTRESVTIIGRRQADKALELLAGPEQEVRGPIRGALAWVDFREAPVPARFASTGEASRTAPALLGQNFIVGTEDGRGPAWFEEGAERDMLVALVARFTAPLSPEVRALHAPKDPFVLLTRPQWEAVPGVLPVQALVLGPLALLACPFELTTMAGRRVRRQLLAELEDLGVREAVPVSMANAYAGYTTTPQEYAVQHYEGASTLFGREQLGALQGVAATLTRALRDGRPPPSLPPPEVVTPGGVQLDGDRSDAMFGFAWFGDVSRDARDRYHPGQTVEVTFWAGHPSSRFLPCYLRVERQVGEGWACWADDHHFATRLHYSSFLGRFLRVTCSWEVGPEVPPGTYRLTHLGTWSAGDGQALEYAGSSRPFEVDQVAASVEHRLAALPEELAGLEPFCRRRKLAAGEVLIREGEEDVVLYLVERGALAVSRGGVELDQLGAGELVGEMGVFLAGKRTATVTAAGPSEVLVLDQAGVARLGDEAQAPPPGSAAPAVMRGLERHALDTLARRLRRVDFILGQVGQARRPPRPPTDLAFLARLRAWAGFRSLPPPVVPRAVDVAGILAGSELFAGTEPELTARLPALFEHRAVPAGAFLCTQGARERDLYLLLAGEVEVVVEDPADRQAVQSLGVLRAGEAFGLTALVDGRPRMASCVARESVDVLVLSREAYSACLASEAPEAGALRRAVIRALADQVRRTNEHLVATGWEGLDVARERARLEGVRAGPLQPR
jgi:neutral ceramidase